MFQANACGQYMSYTTTSLAGNHATVVKVKCTRINLRDCQIHMYIVHCTLYICSCLCSRWRVKCVLSLVTIFMYRSLTRKCTLCVHTARPCTALDIHCTNDGPVHCTNDGPVHCTNVHIFEIDRLGICVVLHCVCGHNLYMYIVHVTIIPCCSCSM